jgi:hypothetical protein
MGFNAFWSLIPLTVMFRVTCRSWWWVMSLSCLTSVKETTRLCRKLNLTGLHVDLIFLMSDMSSTFVFLLLCCPLISHFLSLWDFCPHEREEVYFWHAWNATLLDNGLNWHVKVELVPVDWSRHNNGFEIWHLEERLIKLWSPSG